jgi:hypothetical protein
VQLFHKKITIIKTKVFNKRIEKNAMKRPKGTIKVPV